MAQQQQQQQQASTTNLIINYLPQLYSDEELNQLFSTVGKVNKCKIIREKTTGYSYGFGFVDFATPEEAQAAITTLNGYEIEHKRIKVALARPPGEDTKGANLYIRNIPTHYTEDSLKQVFDSYGGIVQSRILHDHQTGESKGVGFLLFEKKADAEKAMKEMNGQTLADGTQPLMIKFADDNAKKVRAPAHAQQMAYGPTGYGYMPRPNMRGGPMRGPGTRNRYNPMGVAGGPGNGYGGYAGGYAGGYGPMGGRGRGIGGSPIRGAGYAQNYAGAMGETGEGVTLFVYNIGNDATTPDLWNLFSPYGRVVKANVIYDHAQNKCKGYGFVTMSTMEEAKYAIDYLNGYYYKTAPLQVSIKDMTSGK